MRSIRSWAGATFILCFLVIIAGGIVRTTQSGMGCPDWPRCFGRWIPPTNASELPADFEKYLGRQDIDHSFNVFHTWVEYFNRLLGALLGVFAIIQLSLLFKRRKAFVLAYRLAIAFLGMVILTGLFGAIVVKLNLAHLSISIHLLFAILLLQLQLALWLAIRNKLFIIPVSHKLKQVLYAFLVVLLVQAVLGTLVRIYVDDVSRALGFQQRDSWLAARPVAFLIHRTFSWIVLVFATGLYIAYRHQPLIKNKLLILAAIIYCSMITGIILFYADMPAIAQPVHLLLASLAITQCVGIILQAAKHPPAS